MSSTRKARMSWFGLACLLGLAALLLLTKPANAMVKTAPAPFPLMISVQRLTEVVIGKRVSYKITTYNVSSRPQGKALVNILPFRLTGKNRPFYTDKKHGGLTTKLPMLKPHGQFAFTVNVIVPPVPPMPPNAPPGPPQFCFETIAALDNQMEINSAASCTLLVGGK